MSRIWSMMDIGRRSMANSQTALSTTAHNIANKSTEGYSRQRVEIVTNESLGEGQNQVGMGARPGSVSRVNDQFLEKQLEREGNVFGYADARHEMLGRVEQVYNEQSNEGITHSIGKLFNSFRELSNNPESVATRTEVKESALALCKDFRNVRQQLRDITKDADFRITTKVEEINQLTKEIASLNAKVQSAELGGGIANDERDRRDHLLKELSQRVNIKYAESKDGALTVTAGNMAVLVSGHSQRDLYAIATPARPGKAEDNVDIFYKPNDNSNPILMTKQLNGGQIGGLLQVRDEVMGGLVKNVDEVAFTLANEINRIHTQGYDRNGRTGNVFFANLDSVENAAHLINLDEAVSNDVARVAAAGGPNAPGDNRVANIISRLENKQIMNNGTSTVADFYNSIVGKVGIEAQRAGTTYQSQKDIVGQMRNIRESLSGVSLDEETTKLIEFQKAYDASARLIKTVDEMLDTVLRLKPM